MAGAMHIGVEIAGSPIHDINALGPTVVAADFGGNAGLILGPVIAGWREAAPSSLTCETFIDERLVGTGSAASITGGPLTSLAFILSHCAGRGRPLKAGDLVTTGAATGVHDISPGQVACIRFGEFGQIFCQARAAKGGAA
jgi:2-keto-4-pentenoate hydratase